MSCFSLKKVIFILAVFTALPTQAFDWSWIQKQGTLLKCTAVAGIAAASYFLGRKHSKKAKARPVNSQNNQQANAADDEEDKKLHGVLAARLGPDIPKEISAKKLREFEMLSYQERYRLVPAVIEILGGYFSPKMIDFTRDFEAAFTRYQTSQQPEIETLRKANVENKPIAVYAFIFSKRRMTWELGHYNFSLGERHLLNQQLQNPEVLFHKFKDDDGSSQVKLLDAALLPGEVAFVGFSDGDIRILLSESDRKTLINLSHEQRDFVASLFRLRPMDNNDWKLSRSLSHQEQAMLSSLTLTQQASLKRFYNLQAQPIMPNASQQDIEDRAFSAGVILGGTLAACLTYLGWTVFS